MHICAEQLSFSHSTNTCLECQSALEFTKMNKVSFYLVGRLQNFFRWRQDLFTHNSNTNLKRHKVSWEFIGRRNPFLSNWRMDEVFDRRKYVGRREVRVGCVREWLCGYSGWNIGRKAQSMSHVSGRTGKGPIMWFQSRIFAQWMKSKGVASLTLGE